jgi:hypothetical protein
MNLHRHLLWIAVSAALLSLTGCDDSKNPLSDPRTAKPDERLVGVWRLPEEDGGLTYYHVGRAGDKSPKGMLQVAYVRHEKGKISSSGEFFAFPTVLGEKRYLNVALEEEPRTKPSGEKVWKAEQVVSYFVFKYQVEGDHLLLWPVNSNVKKQAIKDGKIKGVVEEGLSTKFTDTTENVARFVAQAGDGLFAEKPLRLERIDAGKKP